MDEQREEVVSALADLRSAGCRLVMTIQYRRPSVRHHPVPRWVEPGQFDEPADAARELGFAGVMSGPLVRSSHRAGRLHAGALRAGSPGRGMPDGGQGSSVAPGRHSTGSLTWH